MLTNSQNKNDICALSTANGVSAIAVLRVSGPNSLTILKKLCRLSEKKSIKPRNVFLAYIFDSENNKIDQVLVTYFEDKHSYTGESSFEVSCHGSPTIIKSILNRMNELGARSAEPGEFTYRAFLNNKIDLIQAESILSLIESETEQARKVSLRQLDGEMSEKFKKIESDLIWCLAHIEASIDFSTEGLDVANTPELIKKLTAIKTELKKMIEGFKQGKLIKDGLTIALLGRPNVGKSSLLNALVQSNRAIVTDIAGTTRDVIESSTIYNGLKINILDTAGIRDTEDQVEKIGVGRSLSTAEKVDICLVLLEAQNLLTDEDKVLLEKLKDQKVIVLVNKKDLTPKLNTNYFSISTQDSNCRDQVLNYITSQFAELKYSDQSVMTSARQVELTEEALIQLDKVLSELDNDMGAEFVSQTLKESMLAVQKIIGEVYDDQILDRVFKEFCLGK